MTGMLRQVELVTGTAADVPAVDTVMSAAFDPQFGEAWTRTQIVGVLVMSGVWLTLARTEAGVVGFALSRAVADEAELLLLAVSPAARRRGVGGALLRSMIAEARGRGIAKVHLEVRASNDAIALYTSAGFVKTGERRAYYRGVGGRAHDAHSYALSL